MDNFDTEKAKRVWQRVHSGDTAADAGDLPSLILGEMEAAGAYRLLARQLPGQGAAMAQKLAEQASAAAACLKGIHILITGQCPAGSTPPMPRETPEVSLRRCYGQELRRMAVYEQRAADAQYGAVYASLSRQKQETLRLIPELLGTLPASARPERFKGSGQEFV